MFSYTTYSPYYTTSLYSVFCCFASQLGTVPNTWIKLNFQVSVQAISAHHIHFNTLFYYSPCPMLQTLLRNG